MNEFSFVLHKDKWILSPVATITGGFGHFEVPPVTIIEWSDKEQLKAVIQNLFDQPISFVKPDDVLDPLEPLGVRAKAVEAKSINVYVRDTRCFYIFRKEDQILLEEWTKARTHWSGNPVWKKKFLNDQLDELIAFLMRKTKPEASLSKKSKRKVLPSMKERMGKQG